MKTIALYLRITILCLSFSLISTKLCSQNPVHHWQTAVFKDDTWKYIMPQSAILNWNSPTFDDTSWASGIGGFGYDDNDDNTIIWKTGDAKIPYSVYIRTSFDVADTSKILYGCLSGSYDDGFIAYLNGVEIARDGLTGTPPAYNQLATNHDATTSYDQFLLDKAKLRSCFHKGRNVLAIEVHNSSPTSSDMSSNFYLSFGIKDNTVLSYPFRTVPTWFTPPTISTFSSNLPLVIIDTGGQSIPDEPKIAATMSIIDNKGVSLNYFDDVPIYAGNIGIEIRGATSSGYPQTPYGLETRDANGNNQDTTLFNMPKDNDWVLLSNWNEKSFARNIISFDMFRKMGHYATRMVLCEVFLNGTYRGIYLFGEKIKQGKGRVNIANLKPTDISGDQLTGGYIFKTDYNDGAGTYWTGSFPPANRPGVTVNYVYHDPKADELTQEQKNYIATYVKTVETVLYGADFKNPTTGYRAYIDVNSFADYWILEEVARNVDGYKKSRYFYKDKTSKSQLICSGPPWDFDWAWKNLDDCSFLKNTDGSGWAYLINDCGASPAPPSWEYRMLQDSYFKNLVYNKYFKNRNFFLSKTALNSVVDSVADLCKSAQVRHFDTYPVLGYNNGAPEIDALSMTYAQEITKLKNWISNRLNWLDANILPAQTSEVETPQSDGIIRVFPNPMKERLYVESDKIIKEVSVINSMGINVMNLKPENSTNRLDVSNLRSGVYFVKVNLINGTSVTQKIIKE